jgi:hypothetical protein
MGDQTESILLTRALAATMLNHGRSNKPNCQFGDPGVYSRVRAHVSRATLAQLPVVID